MDHHENDRQTFFDVSRSVILSGVLFFVLSSRAQIYEIALPSTPAKISNPSAIKMRDFENSQKFSDCAKAGRSAYSPAVPARAWVLKAWLGCAVKADRKAQKIEEIPLALKAWSQAAGIEQGPWTKELMQNVTAARFAVLELAGKSFADLVTESLNQIFEELALDDKGGRAKAFLLLGDFAQLKHNMPGAEMAFTQSLKLQDSSEARSKLKAIKLVLNRAPEEPSKAASVYPSAISELEQQFELRFKNAKIEEESVNLSEDLVSYMNKLPNGIKIKWVTQTYLEIHQTIWERVSTDWSADRWNLLHGRWLATLDKLDSSRSEEMVPLFYKRGDYKAALRFGQKSIEVLGQSSKSSALLWYTGRSAQLLGDYKAAEKYFGQYFEFHSGGEFTKEVLFQWAITHFRQKNYSSSIALFERLLTLDGIDKFELNSRYWMIRSMQALKNDRANVEIQKAIEKFPFSYYGLRLRAELKDGNLDWPSSNKNLKDLKAKLYLNSTQKKTWDRIQWLKNHAWTVEAQAEINQFSIALEPETKILMAQEFSRMEVYPSVIKLLSEAIDQAPEYRGVEVMQLGLPMVYNDPIKLEAQNFSLNPILVRSLIRQESAFFPKAISSSNALGLMQLIPPTAKEVAQELRIKDLEIPDGVFRVDTNVRMGTSYLAKMIKSFEGVVPLGLAAYNAGPRKLQIFLRSRPGMMEQILKAGSDSFDEIWFDEFPATETSFYVKAILRNTILYKVLDLKKVKLEGVIWQDLVLSPNSITK